MRRASRRVFLTQVGGLVAVGVLAACQQAPTAPAAKEASKPPAVVPPTAAPAVAPPTAAPAKPAEAAKPADAPKPTEVAAAKPAAGTPKRGGAPTVLMINDFPSMDPTLSSGNIARACFDWLIAWRPNASGSFAPEPMLAKSWEVSGNKLVMKLRENVKFHDGSPFDADAVAWNITRMVQHPKSFSAAQLKILDKNTPAQALDPLTVQINMQRPSSAILGLLSDSNAQTPMYSKKALEEKGEEWARLNAVGTGPFSFVSFTPGSELKVKKNEQYWQMGADGKALPYVDAITYRVIIEATTQFNEMRAGTADVMSNVRGRDVPAAKQIAHAEYLESPYTGNKRQYFFNALKPPFKDNLKLRQAIHHAVDRDAIAKAIGAELGIALPYEIVPGQVGYDTAVPFYEFNLDKAKALIAESGVTTPLTVRMTVHNREQDQQQAQLVQAMVDKIGVKVDIDVVERTAWVEKVRGKSDFEIASRQSSVGVDPIGDLLVTWSEQEGVGYHRASVPGLIDTLNQADAEFDATKRQELFVKAQTIIHDSAWFGYMWFELGNFLVHKRIKGFSQAWGSLREQDWWVEG